MNRISKEVQIIKVRGDQVVDCRCSGCGKKYAEKQADQLAIECKRCKKKNVHDLRKEDSS